MNREGDAGNGLDRRAVLKLTAGTVVASVLPLSRAASSEGGRHGLSVFGNLKYAPGFPHFDYVRPDAPKGGRIVLTASTFAFNQNPSTFNTLNSFVLKGDSPPMMQMTFDSLMVRALDEPDAVYGLVAKAVSVSEDGNSYTFDLHENARFHDGSPLTAEDVVFSFSTLKEKGHGQIRQTIGQMAAAEAVAPHRVVVRFSGKQTRQLPLYVATLPIFSKAWWQGRDFTGTTLDAPLGSGPYKVGRFEVGRFIEYDRVADYWAKNLPAAVGTANFDTVRLEFYRDQVVSFEAFKKGGITFHEDFYSKNWATGYDFPAIADGRVKKLEFPDDRPAGAQGWFFNTRREKFADPRTREAIGLAFDFEWSNKNLFYGLYRRTHSYFQNSTMMADGPPSPDELALLEPHRGKLPAEVFAEPWQPPVSDGSGRDRNLLRRANALFLEAGWTRKGRTLVGADGQPLTIEFLSNSPLFERIIQPYIGNLRRLGVQATFRLVDPSQYQSRINNFEFDLVGRRYALSETPDESARQYWSSTTADTPGSFNLSGIKDPVIDELIEKMIRADNRDAMTTAARALDRVLRAGRYWVPNWYKPVHTVAAWDRFGWPDKKPRYGFPVETTWWYDKDKAAKLDSQE